MKTKNHRAVILRVPATAIESRIYLLRGQKVMIDRDLAELYHVTTKALNQAVKRNLARFPHDFMFQLTAKEADGFSRSQFVTLNKSVKAARGRNFKYAPYAFSEQGVAMLASVLKSSRAIQVSIAIVRVFVRLREFLKTQEELARRLDGLEHRFEKHDASLHIVFNAIRQMMSPMPVPPKRRIGFQAKSLAMIAD